MRLVSFPVHCSAVLLTGLCAALASGCIEEEGFPVERITTLSKLPDVGAEVTITQGKEGLKLEVIVRYAGRAHSSDKAIGSKASPYCPVLDDSFSFHLGDAGIGVTTSGELELNGLDEHFICHHPSVTMIVPPFLQRANTQLILRDRTKTIAIDLGDRLMARTVERVNATGWELVRDQPFSVRFQPASAVAELRGIRLEAYTEVPYLQRQFVGVSSSFADATGTFVYPATAPTMAGFLRFPLQMGEATCGPECRIQARYDVEQSVTVN